MFRASATLPLSGTVQDDQSQKVINVIVLVMHIINGSHDRVYYEQPSIVHQHNVYLD